MGIKTAARVAFMKNRIRNAIKVLNESIDFDELMENLEGEQKTLQITDSGIYSVY